MKWLITLVLLVIMATSYSQAANKDEMVKKVFATLKNKDEEGYVKLFPDAETMKTFLKGMFSADTSDKGKEMMAMMNQIMQDVTDSGMQAKFRKDFKRYIKKGEEKGIDWAGANLQSYSVDSVLDKDEEMRVSELNGKIYFNSPGKEFFLQFEEIIWIPNKGWYGVDIKRIDVKSKENEADDFSLEDDYMNNAPMTWDSTSVAMDSIAVATPKILESPPTPKKPQLKKVTKPQPVKPKTKTQTPAKKPE